MLNLSIFKKTKVIAAAVMGVVLGCTSTVSVAAPQQKSAVLQGKITGTKIANARYVTRDASGKISLQGYTTSAGAFRYRNGDSVSFYVGDVLLGKTKAKSSVPTSLLITNAMNADALANLLRFLQTIDSDLNPINGIQISANTHYAAEDVKVNFDAAMSSFQVQSSLQQLLALATNSPTLPDAVEALTNFRMSLLNAYNTNSGQTVLNMVNTKWKSTLSSADCEETVTGATHTFNLLGHMTIGYHNLSPRDDGSCRGSSAAILMSLYESDQMFSCANGCTLADLNTTVTLRYPTVHQAQLVHQPNSNIITVIHQYDDGREVIETLVKQPR